MKAVNRTRAEAQGPEGDLIQIQRGPFKGRRPRPELDLDQITRGALSLGPSAIYCLHECDISSPELDIGGITLMSHISMCAFTFNTTTVAIWRSYTLKIHRQWYLRFKYQYLEHFYWYFRGAKYT